MKRHFSDYVKGDESKTKSSSLYKTQKISFKMFQQREVIHLKSLYPFLTKAQINNKVREQWKCMPQNEKQGFSKTVLTKTPTKSPSSTQQKNRQCYKKYGKLKCSIWSDFKTDKKTPTYQSDFSSPSTDQCVTQKQSPDWLKNSENFPLKKNYSKVKNQNDNLVPEIIDETPGKQEGILKPADLERLEDTVPLKKKNRVSFSPKKETEPNFIPETCSPCLSLCGNSSEDDCTLIRRDTTNYDEIDNFQMCVEGDENQGEIKMEATRSGINNDQENFNNSKFSSQSVNENYRESKAKKNKKEAKKVTPEILHTRITILTPSSRNVNTENFTTPHVSDANDKKYTTPLVIIDDFPEGNVQKYTTPMMDDATMKQLMQQAEQAPKKRRSIKDEVGNTSHVQENTANNQKKCKTRTSLMHLKSEDQDELVDASGDARIYIAEPLKPEDEGKINEKVLIIKQKGQEINAMCKQQPPANVIHLSDKNMSYNDIDSTEIQKDNLPTFSGSTQYFLVSENPHTIEIDVSNDSDDDEVLDAFKSASNSTVLETLKRMKEAALVRPSPIRSPEMSPKILSPALSGISQLSGVSSGSTRSVSSFSILPLNSADLVENGQQTSKETDAAAEYSSNGKEDTARVECRKKKKQISEENTDLFTECSKDKNMADADEDIEHDREDNSELTKRKITRNVARKGTIGKKNVANVIGEPLCDLFYDMTPPEEKRKKQSNRRLLASAVTQGNSNFKSLFDSNNDSIF